MTALTKENIKQYIKAIADNLLKIKVIEEGETNIIPRYEDIKDLSFSDGELLKVNITCRYKSGEFDEETAHLLRDYINEILYKKEE